MRGNKVFVMVITTLAQLLTGKGWLGPFCRGKVNRSHNAILLKHSTKVIMRLQITRLGEPMKYEEELSEDTLPWITAVTLILKMGTICGSDRILEAREDYT